MALERERMLFFWISGSNLKWNLCQTATGGHPRPFEFVNKTTSQRLLGFSHFTKAWLKTKKIAHDPFVSSQGCEVYKPNGFVSFKKAAGGWVGGRAVP